MRRVPLLVALVAVALLGLVIVAQPTPRALAQEATPAGEEFALEGVSFEPLAVTSGLTLPSPGNLVLVRIGLDPGAVLPSDPSDPSLAMVLIETGELTVQLDAPVTVTRAGSFAPALATAEAGGEFVAPGATVAAGEAVTLLAGDVAFLPANVGGEVRNDGAERVVGLAFIVAPPEEGDAVPAEGTPAGTPVS